MKLIIDTDTPTQELTPISIDRPKLDTPHQIGVSVVYLPRGLPASGVTVRLTHVATGAWLEESTNELGKALFELLNLEFGYLNGDEIAVEVIQ